MIAGFVVVSRASVDSGPVDCQGSLVDYQSSLMAAVEFDDQRILVSNNDRVQVSSSTWDRAQLVYQELVDCAGTIVDLEILHNDSETLHVESWILESTLLIRKPSRVLIGKSSIQIGETTMLIWQDTWWI
jgi:hypothetical protein